MRNSLTTSLLFAHSITAAVALAQSPEGVTTLTLVTEGAASRTPFTMQNPVPLSATKPEALKKSPEGLVEPRYAILPITGKAGVNYLVIVDEPDDKPTRLFVDTNGNGDLTDDAPNTWALEPIPSRPGGPQMHWYKSGAMLDLGDDKPYIVHIDFYRTEKDDPRKHVRYSLLFSRDYATEGKITLGDKTYPVMLVDEFTRGDFRGMTNQGHSGVQVMIDRNNNGKIDEKGEAYDVRQPFNIGGVTYELKDVSKDGLSFKVVKSEKTVAEIPDLSPGQPAVPFEAKLLDGTALKFPADYKGKIVMMDFWATWCGPCIMEMPNVVAVNEKFKDKGFEILGISLDAKDAEDEIKQTTTKQKMTWPQVYDGGHWSSRVPQLYAVDSIPMALLVDGDTGKIIASGEAMHGSNLAGTIKKALAEKAKK